MKQFFTELLEYGHHFNQKLAAVFVERPDKTSEKSLQLFSHILNAHHIWNNRVDRLSPAYTVWDIHPAYKFKNIDQTSFQHSLAILAKYDLNHTVNYANSKGEVLSNSIRDILFHVFNHSTYHRAQIATDFRQNGINPLMTDYILYKM